MNCLLLLIMSLWGLSVSDALVSKSVNHQMARRTNSFGPLFVGSVQEQRSILAGKEFQLEEREDRDTENTRIFLNEDGSVTLQDTDGPQFKAYQGQWSITETTGDPMEKSFRMRLDRVFESGMEARQSTDIGVFDYQVNREYWGNMSIIQGGIIQLEGVIHLLDDDNGIANYEVGYFALIDSNVQPE